ncbi:MAG: ABC transporter permease subunit, partial [Spirochaetia bacterium]
MQAWKEIRKSLIVSVWFMFLTLPLMVVRVNTIENSVKWRWLNLVFVGVGAFALSFVWRYMLEKKHRGEKIADFSKLNLPRKKLPRLPLPRKEGQVFSVIDTFKQKKVMLPSIGALLALVIIFPFISSMYQTNIMSTALMYVMLGLGLNIVVGLGGLLHLGYIAFYAVGAYTYALLNHHFGVNFWVALPLGGLASLTFGLLLGIPVLRLRGDYLAIVTLAFGEIVRIVLENWNEFSFGPSGIANIPRPGFFGIDFRLKEATIYIYFLMIALTIFTIFIVARLKNSRLGRALEAMREDDIASEAMGIDIMKSKLITFGLGALWAGFAGVMFAAKTTFINPASFTVWESILVLCIVVLGGMGSIVGVGIGALVLILLPEYL